MEDIMLINRAESKGVVSHFTPAARKAFDMACAASTDIAGKTRGFEEDTASDFHRIAIAFHLMTEDKEGMKAADMTQATLAQKVFNMKPALASQYKTVAREFLCINNPPEVSRYYNPATLYNLHGIAPERLDADFKSGVLKKGMCKNDLRAYADSVLSTALDATAKPETVKTYDGTLQDVEGHTDDFKGLIEDEIIARMNCGIMPDESMVHTFTSGLKRIVKDRKGADKEKPVKVTILETPAGNMVMARYYQHIEDSKPAAKAAVNTAGATEDELAILRKYGIVK